MDVTELRGDVRADEGAATRPRRPWHLWPVAVVGLLLSAVGLYDFVMVATHDVGYLQGMYGPAGLEYFTGYPLVLLVLFAVNVLGGAVAFLVVPWRRMLAVRLMLVAALADALLIVVTVVLRDRWSVMGAGSTLRDTAVCAAFFGCAGYFFWLHRREAPRVR